MPVCLSINPPKIIPWLTQEERQLNVILLDFEADLLDTNCLRLDLNVVFNPLSVRRGKVTRADYYVGSTGAEISLRANNGTILEFTEAQTLEVNYSNTTKRRRKASISLSPSIKQKDGKEELELQGITLGAEGEEERVFSASFSSGERQLAAVVAGNEIKWVLTLPRGERVIRDFILGNLYLFATCTWGNATKAGEVSVRPSDVRFFDAERRPLGLAKSLIMEFVLWRKGIKLRNRDGFSVNFAELNQ